MEREMATLQQGIKRIEDSYGPDHLHLMLAVGYARSLLGNSLIARYLKPHYRELWEEFAKILEATALGPEATA